MELGKPVTVPIHSEMVWSPTEITLVEGATYQFTASGTWVDWYIKYGPSGGPSGLNPFLLATQHWRRQPNANWCALIGAIDQEESTAFLIGSRLRRVAKPGGKLFCYANDVPWAYGNNKGYVDLTVELVRPPA